MVQLLLDAGAGPNLRTKKGMTPLIGAAMHRRCARRGRTTQGRSGPDRQGRLWEYGGRVSHATEARRAIFRVCELVREALHKR